MKELNQYFYASYEGFSGSLGHYKIYLLDDSLLGIKLSGSYRDTEYGLSVFVGGLVATAISKWLTRGHENKILEYIFFWIVSAAMVGVIAYFIKRFYAPDYRKKQDKEEKRYEAVNFDVPKMLKMNKKYFLLKSSDIKEAKAFLAYRTNYAEIFLVMLNKKKYHFVLDQVPVMAQLHDLLSKSIKNIQIETE